MKPHGEGAEATPTQLGVGRGGSLHPPRGVNRLAHNARLPAPGHNPSPARSSMSWSGKSQSRFLAARFGLSDRGLIKRITVWKPFRARVL